MPSKVEKIISGGQTGADRAALDFAIANGIEHGGFIPAGRLAEDGPIPSKYTGLTETASADTAERTRLNVFSSDGTILISLGPLSGGSQLTEEYARSMKKPLLHLDLSVEDETAAAAKAAEWLELTDCRVINIAGPRGSEAPGIYSSVLDFLESVFKD